MLLKRFELEARSTASLTSAHTVDIYDFGVTDDGRQWNVSPALLSKAVPPKGKNRAGSNVVLLSKR